VADSGAGDASGSGAGSGAGASGSGAGAGGSGSGSGAGGSGSGAGAGASGSGAGTGASSSGCGAAANVVPQFGHLSASSAQAGNAHFGFLQVFMASLLPGGLPGLSASLPKRTYVRGLRPKSRTLLAPQVT